jgi:hypothetical protein
MPKKHTSPRTEATESDKRKIKSLVSTNIKVLMWCGNQAYGKKLWCIHHIVWNFSHTKNLAYDVAKKWFCDFTHQYAQSQYYTICKEMAPETLKKLKSEVLRKYVHRRAWRWMTCSNDLKPIMKEFKLSAVELHIVISLWYREFAEVSQETMAYEDRKYIKGVINFVTLRDAKIIPEQQYEEIAMHLVKPIGLVKSWVERQMLCEQERIEDETVEAQLLMGFS